MYEELQAFVEHDTDSKVRSGLAPEEARRAALMELGGVEQVKERVREARAGVLLESLAKDTRYASRTLRQAPGYSFSVMGNLSLGLAATIVAFAFINGALLRPTPGIRDQARLVEIEILQTYRFGRFVRTDPARTALVDYPNVVRTLREGTPSLDGLASFFTVSDVAATLPQPRSLRTAFVSSNYFDVLGVQPEVGRPFAPEEDQIASASVAVISRALWMQEFGGNPAVIGQPIQVGERTLDVIGVVPQGFTGTGEGPFGGGIELWLPTALADSVTLDDRSFGQTPGEHVIRYVGRLRDGVRVDRVETELDVVAGRLGVARPAGDFAPRGRLVTSAANPSDPVTAEASGLSRLDGTEAVALVAIILPVPLLVLAIACINAGNLLLVRASRRRREVAVRLALGASRLRVIRQLVIESLVLALGAALLALPLTWSVLQVVATFMTVPVPLDGTVVAGALVTAFLTALGFGLIPALHATGQHPSAALGTSRAGTGGTHAEARGRRALVAGQVALTLGLLASAFQLTSVLESMATPPGTDPGRVLMASFDLAQVDYSSSESDAFYAALLDRASRLPGVEAAGLSSLDFAGTGLFSTGWTSDPANLVFLDRGEGPAQQAWAVSGPSAGGDFFGVLGLNLMQGREFVAADRRDMPEVAIVTEYLASQILDGAALGQTLRVLTTLGGDVEADVRIVGIVESPVELSGKELTGVVQPSRSTGEVAAIFFPSPLLSPVQDGTARTLYLRSEGPAAVMPAVRDLVAGLDPQVPILGLATLEQKLRAGQQFERGLARGAALLGLVALLLASVGLYGVTAYAVEMRAPEIAVRMALGARADGVIAMVVRQAFAVVTIGAVLGGLAAITAGLVMQAQVFGVDGVDVATLGGSAALLGVGMLLASLLPAWRAARLDPSVVLRGD